MLDWYSLLKERIRKAEQSGSTDLRGVIECLIELHNQGGISDANLDTKVWRFKNLKIGSPDHLLAKAKSWVDSNS